MGDAYVFLVVFEPLLCGCRGVQVVTSYVCGNNKIPIDAIVQLSFTKNEIKIKFNVRPCKKIYNYIYI